MPKLSEEAIESRLRSLEGWRRQGDAITKTFTFSSFPEAISFVHRVADTAEASDHHPDIDIRYRRVTLSYWTHTEGGVTEKDFEGARAADRCA
ncbi:MAG: 4a-hydroxytetrahydrobiopterin dehydratase [Vicinamibacterales bacterium]